MSENLLTSQVGSFFRTARRYWYVAAAPFALITAAAVTHVYTQQPVWKASQGLIVRDQASERSVRGEFESLDAMKTAQETIVEISHNRVVARKALTQVGPPVLVSSTNWPSEKDVDDLLENITITAPKGAEFGTTEVIYLKVESKSRQRASELATAVCDALESRLKDIRLEKADSILSELEKNRVLAQTELEQSTAKLESMEREVGHDLGELRILNTQGSGESNLRSGSRQIKNELRVARSQWEEQQQMMSFLQSAMKDPTRILGAPPQLLETQPALRRLKDGLVDAQLRTATLSGTRSADHPLMKAARIAEQEVRRDLFRELDSAGKALNAEMKVSEQLVGSLETQLGDVTHRLEQLAGLRARYGNLVAEVQHKTQIVADANKAIADMRASQKAARETSLLTRIDAPVTADKPEGPGKSTIVATGIAGGVAASVGVLLLLTPAAGAYGGLSNAFFGRRRGDHVAGERRGGPSAQNGPGRRQSDQASGERRDSDGRTTPIDSQPPTNGSHPPDQERRSGDRRRGDRRRG